MNRIKLIYLQQNRTETGNARRDRWPCPLPLGRSPADEFGCETVSYTHLAKELVRETSDRDLEALSIII